MMRDRLKEGTFVTVVSNFELEIMPSADLDGFEPPSSKRRKFN
jgi:hypothetical protein